MKSKIIYGLLSVAIAFGLWLYVIVFVSPESTETFRGVEVSLINEDALYDKRLMVLGDELSTVTLHLEGNRSDLNKLALGTISVTADVSRLNTVGEDQQVYCKVTGIPDNVSWSLEPSSIKVNVVERSSKDIPVEVEYVGKVPEGFLTDKENLVLLVDTIPIDGPSFVVDQIAKAVVTVDLEGMRESIVNQSYVYTLCDEKGEPVDVSYLDPPEIKQVNLSLTIQRVKEIQFSVKVIPGGGATEENTVITLSHTSIQVSGSEQLLEELGDTIHLGELRLAEITNSSQKEFTFSLPKGVTNLTMVNNRVSASIRFEGLKTKTLRATNIQARNVPAGLIAEIKATELFVNIRGPEESVSMLTEENMIVVVDFSNAEAGTTGSYPVLIYLVDADDCGAVGSYYVYASVTEGAENPDSPETPVTP